MKIIEIKKYWETAGQEFPKKTLTTPTSRDYYLSLLERNNIFLHLKKHHRALEMGCGAGTHSIYYAAKVKILCAIDIAESLIKIAQSNASRNKIKNINFNVCSVLNLHQMFEKEFFDCIISQRCLINLPEWQYQKKALLIAHQLLKRGGLFILSEGFQSEIMNLNQVRKKFGLHEIKVVNYNKNFNRTAFEKFITPYFNIVDIRDYGAYLFFSRVFYPLTVFPDEPKHSSRYNKIAMKISSSIHLSGFEKYSYNLFYVLQKK